MSSYQRIPSAGPATDASGAASFEAGVSLPNSSSLANSITFGPATAAGVRLGRNASGVLQASLGDLSGNAAVAGSQFRGTNDLGVSAPNYSTSYQAAYGVYVQNAGPYVGFAAAGNYACRTNSSGQTNFRRPVVNGYGATLVPVDTATIYHNSGATAQAVFSLPSVFESPFALVPNGTTYTFVNTDAGATFLRVRLGNGARFVLNGTLGSTTNPSLTSTANWTTITVTHLYGSIWLASDVTGTWTLV